MRAAAVGALDITGEFTPYLKRLCTVMYVCMCIFVWTNLYMMKLCFYCLSSEYLKVCMYVCMYVHRRFYQCQQDLSICMYIMYVQYVCMYMYM